MVNFPTKVGIVRIFFCLKKIWIVALLLLPTLLQAQRYATMHRRAFVADTHNDIPSAAIEKQVPFDADLKGKTHSDLARMRSGGVDAQMFSIFCDGAQKNPFLHAQREIDSVYAWVARNENEMMLVKNTADLQKARKTNKLAAMLGVEGGHMIENNIANLNTLYERGVRYLTITWNNSTSWATSAADETSLDGAKNSEGKKGLTAFGQEVIKKMNTLGMMVDVSHAGEQTFWDIMTTTQKPVIASHSCVWNLCMHRRNLKDDQIKAIARNGGVIFLNFYAGFLDSIYERKRDALFIKWQDEINVLIAKNIQTDYARMMVAEEHQEEMRAIRPSLDVLMDHLDYIVRLAGIDHVGLGSDFDGVEALPLPLEGVENMPLITQALLKRGYTKSAIQKILGENFLRVLKAQQ